MESITRYTMATLAACVLLTDGCTLTHASRPPNEFGSVSPRHYCPGDTVTASYDLAMETPCVSRAGMDCATVGPAITISSAPESFPPQTSTRLANGLTFTPTAPRVDVSFAPSTTPFSFVYPSVNPTTGAPALTLRWIRTTTRPVERIEGSIAQTLSHGGMCNGTTPANAPAQIVDLPEFSANLRVQQLCNTSAVPIEATLAGASGEFTRRLAPGECFALDEPGVPSGLGTARTVSVRPLAIDPAVQCSAVQGSTPPQTLTTRAVLACGP
jgi:hypothetical protein